MTSIAVAGATGYAGGEILRLLLGHPYVCSGELKIIALSADSSAGSNLHQHHGNLFSLADYIIDPSNPELLSQADIVFCALPHGASARLVSQFPDSVRVIDCGADYRLADAQDWKKYYGTEHAGYWPYGLPELPGYRQKISSATRIAVPGCFPTVATLALYPAVSAGVIDSPVTITAVTGTSGAGKNASSDFTASEVLGSIRAYGIAGTHRHVPEIEQNLRQVSQRDYRVIFTPVIAPVARGILAVCTGKLATQYEDIDTETLREIYQLAYAHEPFVYISHSGDSLPNTAHVLASNMVEIAVQVDDNRKTVTIVGAIDNLVKGTAGAAVQNMNLLLGYPETTGLSTIGVAP